MQTADFPPGPGLESFLNVCAPCHGPQIVTSVRLSQAGWEDVIVRMAQRGAVGTDSEFAEILDYLSRNYSASDPPRSVSRSPDPD
jgi:competence protein ComEA